MNRRIAAWTIATVAVLGLTACSGATTASDDTSNAGDTSNSAPAEETNTDQSVADACASVGAQVQEATGTLTGLDLNASTEEPQATVDAFTETVDAIGAAADSVSNEEVKAATTSLHENFVTLRDILSAVLVDQDMSAASDINTVTADLTEASTAFQELCS